MLANIRDGRDLAIVAKDRNPLPGERYDSRAFLGNTVHFTDLYKTFLDRLMSRSVNPLLTKGRCEMKRNHSGHSRHEGRGQYGTRL